MNVMRSVFAICLISMLLAIQAGSCPQSYCRFQADDLYGEDALKEGMDGAGAGSDHNPFDHFFESFLGGGSTRGTRQICGEDVVHPLKVSLEDLYLGTTKKLSLSRNVPCSKCNSKGSKSGGSMDCPGFQGRGMNISIRQLGPGMIQQVQHPCNECKGTREAFDVADRCCQQCKGDDVVPEKKVLEVGVEKGMKHGQTMTFPGEADLAAKEHPKFKRKGEDLFIEHTLSLTEALCGFKFVLKHLDGRQILIKSEPGEVVKPDSFKATKDEGTHTYQIPFMKSKLYIHFTVDFPDSLMPEQIKALEAILPQKPESGYTDMEFDKCEETTLHDLNMEQEMRRKQQQALREEYEEEDEMDSGTQDVVRLSATVLGFGGTKASLPTAYGTYQLGRTNRHLISSFFNWFFLFLRNEGLLFLDFYGITGVLILGLCLFAGELRVCRLKTPNGSPITRLFKGFVAAVAWNSKSDKLKQCKEDLELLRREHEQMCNTIMAQLDSTEELNSFLKNELYRLKEEVEVRNKEVEFNRRFENTSRRLQMDLHVESGKRLTNLEAECNRLHDRLHKELHIENWKRVAKLDAECLRLRGIMRKQQPTPSFTSRKCGVEHPDDKAFNWIPNALNTKYGIKLSSQPLQKSQT